MLYLSNKKRIFKIGRLERLLKQTVNRQMDGRTEKRTDRRTKSIKVGSLMQYLSNKKRIFKIGQLELVLEGGYRQTDGFYPHDDVNTYFSIFFNSFELKKRKVG